MIWTCSRRRVEELHLRLGGGPVQVDPLLAGLRGGGPRIGLAVPVPAGPRTALVSGVGSATGEAWVAIFELPQGRRRGAVCQALKN